MVYTRVVKPGVRVGLCDPSYWEGGIWGWLEDGSPLWRLLVPLWEPHLYQDQFQTPLVMRPLPWSVGWSRRQCSGLLLTPVRSNSKSAKFHSSLLLNYSCFGVKIELAVGTFLSQACYGFQKCPGWDRLLPGFPICNLCLDMRQNPSKDTHFSSCGRRPSNQTNQRTKPKTDFQQHA